MTNKTRHPALDAYEEARKDFGLINRSIGQRIRAYERNGYDPQDKAENLIAALRQIRKEAEKMETALNLLWFGPRN